VKGIKYILFMFMLLVSQVVFAAMPIYGTTSESRQAHNFKPPRGKAIVYIYQRLEDGQNVSPTIWINNYEIGRLVPGSFTVWKLSPGRLNIRIGSTESANLSMNMQAGQIYRFRISGSQDTTGAGVKIRLMPASAHSELASTRLIKNPRSISTVVAQAPIQPKPVAPPTKPQASQVTSPESTKVTSEETDTTYYAGSTITPGGMGLMLKGGTLSIAEDRQTILSVDRSFDDSAGLFAAEVYYQFSSGLTVGGELLSYTAKFTTVGLSDTHNVDVTVILANVKKYFRHYSSLQPYIGAGAGLAVTDISGPSIGGNTAGVAYQLLTGIEYRGANVGVFGEFKYLGADTEDDNGESVDVSGTGVLAGVSFHF